MYTIKELKGTFDWSYDQLRDRVLKLNREIGDVFQRGEKNKILISEKGLSLLRKLNDLESFDKSIQSAIETISKDLEGSQSQEERDVSKDFKTDSKTDISQIVEVLKDRVQELQQDKRRLQEKNDTLEQRLITGEVEKKSKTEELREELHEKEIELEKVKVRLERNSENGDSKEDEFKEMGLLQLVKRWLTTKA
jgi:chromosome segregation ATPase